MKSNMNHCTRANHLQSIETWAVCGCYLNFNGKLLSYFYIEHTYRYYNDRLHVDYYNDRYHCTDLCDFLLLDHGPARQPLYENYKINTVLKMNSLRFYTILNVYNMYYDSHLSPSNSFPFNS